MEMWTNTGMLLKQFKKVKVQILKLLLGSMEVHVSGNENRLDMFFNDYFSNIVSSLRNTEFGQDLFLEDQEQYDVYLDTFNIDVSIRMVLIKLVLR